MKPYTLLSPDELQTVRKQLTDQYDNFVERKLDLDMSRGKPAAAQLDLSEPMLHFDIDHISEDGIDARNYGVLDGLPECKRLMGDLLGLDSDSIIIGGTSSLTMMYDTMSRLMNFGKGGHMPWNEYARTKGKVKFLCPSPGYDRHFAICEAFGIEMIPIPLLEDGPAMAHVKLLAGSDPSIKGIWCVPMHSNPQGIIYSDHVIEELATMKTAADDFCIFWDNAYAVHHIYEDVEQKSIFEAARTQEERNRIFYFFSTSKVTFPGAGIALLASGADNIAEIKKHMSIQAIGYDKLNQLRHVQFFKTADNIKKHMRDLAGTLIPKFNVVLETLEDELKELGVANWSNPKGGYFVSVDTLPGCASRTVALAKAAGVKLTSAGATYPYGYDKKDTNIRIAPSYPTLDELQQAMILFCLCLKLATVESLTTN